jgi:UDP-2,3-diacylglucosamine pyrophosphatase LpxH
MKIETAIVASDIHFPYEDKGLIEAAFKAWRTLKKAGTLKYIILNGDIIDCYAISSYAKSLDMSDSSFEDELEQTRVFLRRLRKEFPNTRIIFIEGNHEWRLRRLLMEPKERFRYEWMDKYLHFTKTLELDKLNIEYIQHNGVAGQMRIQLGEDLLIGHFAAARSGSGATAKALMNKYTGYKIIQGHVHKAAIIHKTNGRHPTWSLENPCMCPINQSDYDIDLDWQQGFTIVTLVDGIAHPELVTVDQVTRTFLFRGKVYKIDDSKISRIVDPKIRVG